MKTGSPTDMAVTCNMKTGSPIDMAVTCNMKTGSPIDMAVTCEAKTKHPMDTTKLQKADHVMDGASITSYDSKAPKIQGKVALEGTLQQRLDQLDHRESELLDALERKTEKIKGLTEEKNRWKRRCEEIE
ncbi:hypothetical protein MAR_028457 [Mya arenaria]|uniref:Uncharacterized protein n=1 Tax=Mya arenaria TaxID=6604 RepID=A0ABY7DDP6_MYAAR|nr:hypothetical protein MAR_028457 [Mya arenaria]